MQTPTTLALLRIYDLALKASDRKLYQLSRDGFPVDVEDPDGYTYSQMWLSDADAQRFRRHGIELTEVKEAP
ncbi:MAG: hypothetical protein HC828_21740 [Blastochloris sp.]|nr:hypothetical protein [Blastochloris sp.]